MDKKELAKIINASNSRITVADLELLERACDACQATNILEIGSADGGSSVVLGLKAKEQEGYLYCIEPRPKGKMYHNMKNHDIECFKVIPKASPWVTFEGLVPNGIDLLFIDGYHETRWCLVDYHYWEPKVRHGGVIVFHDTSGGSAEDKRRPEYGQPGYVPLVQRAIDLILETDNLELIDQSDSPLGGAKAFRKL